jgi:hypothetical protein
MKEGGRESGEFAFNSGMEEGGGREGGREEELCTDFIYDNKNNTHTGGRVCCSCRAAITQEHQAGLAGRGARELYTAGREGKEREGGRERGREGERA